MNMCYSHLFFKGNRVLIVLPLRVDRFTLIAMVQDPSLILQMLQLLFVSIINEKI